MWNSNKEVIVLKNMSVNIAKSSSSRLLTIFTFHLSHHMPYHVDLTYDIYIHIYMCHMSTSVISYLFPTVSRFIPYKSSESLPSGDGNQEKTQSKTKTKIWCGFGCWAEERIFYQVIWVRSSIYSWVKSFQKIQTFHGQEILKRFKVVITCTAYNIWTLLSSLLNLHTPNKPHPLLPCGCFLLQTCDPTANNNFDSDIIQLATPDAPYFLDFPSKPVFDRKKNLRHCSLTNFRSTFQLWRGLFLTEMRGAKGFPGIETNSAEPRKTLQKRCQAACNSIVFHLQLKTNWQSILAGLSIWLSSSAEIQNLLNSYYLAAGV